MAKAGRELDAEVAEKVMGWTPYLHKRGEYTHVEWGKPVDRGQPWEGQRDADPKDWMRIYWSDIDRHNHIDDNVGKYFRPSQSIEDAWRVVERMKAKGWWMTLTNSVGTNLVRAIMSQGLGERNTEGVEDTAPLAICLAALEAVKGGR